MEVKKNMKTCPYCCKDVPNNAKKCQYCGEWLIDKKEIRKENNIFRVFSVICFIIFALLLAVIFDTNGISSDGAGGIVFLFVIIYTLYFIPTMIATHKKNSNTTAIFIINLVFGWTFIGWIAALILSVMNDEK